MGQIEKSETRESQTPVASTGATIVRLALAAVFGSAFLAAVVLFAKGRPDPEFAGAPSVGAGRNARPFEERAPGTSAGSAEFAIAKDEIEYLQEVEHLGGFVLGYLAMPKLAKTLRDRDVDKLRGFFAADFGGRLFVPDSGDSVEYPFATFRTWEEDRDQTSPRTRDEFVDDLLAYRDRFEELDACQFKVIEMTPGNPDDFSEAWTGSCKFRLAGRTRGGTSAERVLRFRCRIDGISDETHRGKEWLSGLDAYTGTSCEGARPLMEDMAAETGIDVDVLRDNWKFAESGETLPFLTGGMFLADYDQDGRMDLLVTDRNGIFLYRGQVGARFADVTDQVGLPRNSNGNPAIGAAFADFDNDGFEDLLLGPQLYRNEGGRRFTLLEPGKNTNLALHPSSFKFSVVDYDKDGLLDLYVVGIHTGVQNVQPWIGKGTARRNQLWRNLGDWKFEDVTAKSGTLGSQGGTFGAVWFDANGDDWPDVMTACEFGNNDFLINQRDGTFKAKALPDVYGGFSMGITVGDIDNDGLGDPYLANMYSKAGQRVVANMRRDLYPPELDAKIRDFVSGSELYHNRGSGDFERIGKQAGVSDVGWAYGGCFGDFNGDGFPEMYGPVGFQSVSPHKPDG